MAAFSFSADMDPTDYDNARYNFLLGAEGFVGETELDAARPAKQTSGIGCKLKD